MAVVLAASMADLLAEWSVEPWVLTMVVNSDEMLVVD